MNDFDDFLAVVRARLERGRTDFEDRSLDRPATELVDEIGEELADVAGWAAVLWVRLQRIRELAERVEDVGSADTLPPPSRLVGADRDAALAALDAREGHP